MTASRTTQFEATNPLQLKDAIDLFIENQKMLQRSKLTLRNYHVNLMRLCKYLCEKHNRPVALDEIITHEVEEYLYHLITARKNSTATRNYALKVFGLFYRFCLLKGFCATDVTKTIEYAKWQKKERLFLTENELRLIFDTVEKKIIKLALQTLYFTGMRIGELTRLKIEDVDFKSNVIHITNGKGDKERTIPLHKELKKLLMDYLNNWRLNMKSDYLFCTKSGRISQEYISSELIKTLILAGIEKKVTPHVFRHSFASSLIRKGVNVVQVQKLLGHESLLTTGIYTHSTIEDLSEAVTTLDIL